MTVPFTPNLTATQINDMVMTIGTATTTHDSTAVEQAIDGTNKTRFQKYMDKYPELLPSAPPLKRRFQLAKLDLPMETHEDIALRLSGCIIFVGDIPYYVRDIASYKDQHHLILWDHEERPARIDYLHPKIELRSPEPQYITMRANPVYYYRTTAREQRQGLHPHNVRLQSVGGGELNTLHNNNPFMQAFLNSKDLQWRPDFQNLMLETQILKSMRLNKSIAVYCDYSHKKPKLFAEYRGRLLGELKENCVLIDEDDKRPWILQEIKNIGCEGKVL